MVYIDVKLINMLSTCLLSVSSQSYVYTSVMYIPVCIYLCTFRPCTFHFFCVDFFALGSKRKPNSQWNIGGVGPSGVGAGVGHVHFMFFVLISFAFCSQRKPSFQWGRYGLKA